MKYFLLLIIKIYWKLVPPSRRRSCLFAESCSRYVDRITQEKGFLSGIRAFKERYKKCKPGYKIGYNSLDGTTELLLVDGTILNEQEMSKMFKTK
jgi:putative component of membrane protein insertase Oxa1/YidC/SpoIIIJ protein YidD